MAKKVYYRYNSATDNYERVYPSLGRRAWVFFRPIMLGLVIAAIFCHFAFKYYQSPREEILERENTQLRSQYEVLEKRVSSSLAVMENIRDRDDNFYRVMMQMDPMSEGFRSAGLDNEARYNKVKGLNDAALITRLTQNIDILDRRLFAQSISFDQLRETALKQEEKMSHIPAIIPIKISDYSVASGYGYRKDPIYGSTAFHAGLDFAAAMGTPVYATADGRVTEAGWAGGYGNKIDIDHGFNYLTRYGHLSQIDVKPGEAIKRGQKIGLVGSTGKSTGPHLHYEVRFKGEPQNPVNYYFLDVTPEQYEEMIKLTENAGHVMD